MTQLDYGTSPPRSWKRVVRNIVIALLVILALVFSPRMARWFSEKSLQWKTRRAWVKATRAPIPAGTIVYDDRPESVPSALRSAMQNKILGTSSYLMYRREEFERFNGGGEHLLFVGERQFAAERQLSTLTVTYTKESDGWKRVHIALRSAPRDEAYDRGLRGSIGLMTRTGEHLRIYAGEAHPKDAARVDLAFSIDDQPFRLGIIERPNHGMTVVLPPDQQGTALTQDLGVAWYSPQAASSVRPRPWDMPPIPAGSVTASQMNGNAPIIIQE